MAVAEIKVKKWGNSIGLVIPKDTIRIEDIRVGDTVKVEIKKEKRIDGFGIFKGAPPFERDEEEHGEFW